MILILVALACGPKEVPPHLRIHTPVPEAATTQPPRTSNEAAARLVGTDPLLRRARPGVPGTWTDVPIGAPIEAWARVARRPDAPPTEWLEVEAAHRGTLAVPLTRGAGLAAIEAATAVQEPLGEEGRALLPWLGPVVVDAAILPAGARGPLDWLSQDPRRARDQALHIAERMVLLGWLDGPGIPAGPAAAAIQPGVHDRIIDSPTGALLMARGSDARDPEQAAAGRNVLTHATTLALQEVAADRDSEQEAWRALRQGMPEDQQTDPVGALLATARPMLLADAGNDESLAMALVALTAERIHRSCPDQPCAGLDRVATLAVPARWSATAVEPAAVWRVIAAKQALDSLEVTRQRAGVPAAWLDLADVLVGTNSGSVRHGLLRTRTPDSTTWLELSRLAGGRDATSWEEAHDALRAHLVRLVDDALATQPSDEQRQILERIRRRTK